ncbi:hypothetical protein H4R34_001939 [Dimargaris verticillata]|uniref:Integrator complex subunit 6-like beta-barrel domain-containing protein n=1 Tax=Dimargaris verticillata TaxID=2761393 RepID=A0A9W8BAE4_9FUNG|nr:hypothetical protein H4R34_001939 [Dimargaris verticillata]
MNARMADGLSHLDCAKSGVEYFLKRRNGQRDDKYLLLTYEESNRFIKARIRDPTTYLQEQLKNLRAHDMFNGGAALGAIFDQLNLYRTIQDMDSFGLGRRPWASEPALIFWFTDGKTMIQPSCVTDKLNIPGLCGPGADRYLEPFRWDQRLVTIYLDHPSAQMTEPQINAMCEVMGGAAIHVSSLKRLQQCLDTMLGLAKPKEAVPHVPFVLQPHGVLVNFDCLSGDPARANTKNHHKLLVLTGNANRTTGFFPIPEAYWSDGSPMPVRKAHPTILYHPIHQPVTIPSGFPFDKYVVENCPLTQELLKQPPNTYWQVFVPNSFKKQGGGFTFGFLRVNSLQTAVNLYVLPYNYPALFILLENLRNLPRQAPTPEWLADFEQYLNHTPLYYLHFMRTALNLYGLNQVASLQWSPEIQAMVKRAEQMRAAVRTDSERLMLAARKQLVVTSRPPKSDPMDHQSLVANAFDVGRDTLVNRLGYMRESFIRDVLRNQRSAVRLAMTKDERRHSVPIASMGLFQPVMTKNMEQELRDPLADEEQLKFMRRTLFGNPYVRFDKRSSLAPNNLDNVNEDNIAVDVNEMTNPTTPTSPSRHRLRPRTLGHSRTRSGRLGMASSVNGGDGGGAKRKWPSAERDAPPLPSPPLSSDDASIVPVEPAEILTVNQAERDNPAVRANGIVPPATAGSLALAAPTVRAESSPQQLPSRQPEGKRVRPTDETADFDILSSWKQAMSAVALTDPASEATPSASPGTEPLPPTAASRPSPLLGAKSLSHGPSIAAKRADPRLLTRSPSVTVPGKPNGVTVERDHPHRSTAPSAGLLARPPGTGPPLRPISRPPMGRASDETTPAAIPEGFTEFKQQLHRLLKMDPKRYDERSVLEKLRLVEHSSSFSREQKRSLMNSCVIIARGLRRRAVVDRLERMRKVL